MNFTIDAIFRTMANVASVRLFVVWLNIMALSFLIQQELVNNLLTITREYQESFPCKWKSSGQLILIQLISYNDPQQFHTETKLQPIPAQVELQNNAEENTPLFFFFFPFSFLYLNSVLMIRSPFHPIWFEWLSFWLAYSFMPLCTS